MPHIADTAQIVMDLYFQNFRTDEDFFRLFHFKYLCGVSYSKLLEQEYKQNRREAMLELGFSDVIIPSEWLIEEVVEFKEVDDEPNFYKATFKHPVFTFPYDAVSNGIQTIRPVGKGMSCKEFIREAARRRWSLCDLPMTSQVFWFGEGKDIIAYSRKCKMDKMKVKIWYASDPADESFGEDGGFIHKSKEEDVIRMTLDIMMKARQGTVVDMSNDGNPNKRIQSEINTVLTDDLRTKPIQ
jgi:hypothetical protein